MASLNLYVVTFNCGRNLVDPDAFASVLFTKLPDHDTPLPDVVVLCLEEIAPIAAGLLGGRFVVPYLNAFRHAVGAAAASRDRLSYANIITRNVGLTAIIVFVRQDQKKRIAWVETAGVGFGVWDMGNKGSVGVRVGYRVEQGKDEVVEMAFVAAHLAAHEGKEYLRRRNSDWKSSVRGLVFTSVGEKEEQTKAGDDEDEDAPLLRGIPDERSGNLYQGIGQRGGQEGDLVYGMYKPTSHLFFAGDLNYRTGGAPPSEEDYARYPQPTEDREDKRHYSQHLPHDELRHEKGQGRVLQGLTEADIDFPPTYKYRTGDMKGPLQDDNVQEWPWKQKRWPSWCDRVLWLELPPWMKSPSDIKVNAYGALPLFKTSDHRPVALSVSVPLKSIPTPSESYLDALGQEEAPPADQRVVPPYDLDPDWKVKRESARRKEIVVGLVLYLLWTWEGWILLLTIVVGVLGGWQTVEYLLRREQSPSV